MSLLVTPEDLSRELASSQPPLLIDLRPAENFCENHLPGAVHLDLFGISSVDTDPAPLKAFFWIIEHLLASRGVSNDVAGRRLRRHVGHQGGAGVLVSRVLRSSRTPACSTAVTTRGCERGLPVTQKAREAEADRWTGTRDERILAGWRDVQRSPRQLGCRHPRYAQRRRVLRHERARGERRRDPWRRSSGMDEQSRRPTALSSRRTS